jgi:hypothetical protein
LHIGFSMYSSRSKERGKKVLPLDGLWGTLSHPLAGKRIKILRLSLISDIYPEKGLLRRDQFKAKYVAIEIGKSD